ncbi:hypothetical protein LN249_24195 (plasmid) [Vibrio alginolyticus]|nr:hypothetical protein LN249_24195 [Vibrio alginolyticus]
MVKGLFVKSVMLFVAIILGGLITSRFLFGGEFSEYLAGSVMTSMMCVLIFCCETKKASKAYQSEIQKKENVE